MNPMEIALIVFACVFGGAMLGFLIGNALPDHHLSQDSKEVVKLGTALLATMSALVLGLLTSSAKTAFDKMDGELVENAARVISLDRALADYGPETREIRDLLKRSYAAQIELLFPSDESRAGKEDTPEAVVQAESILTKLWQLSPKSDAQREIRSHAVEITGEILSTRWLILLQNDESIPMVLLVVLTSWLSIIFTTFGLLAPRNATVVASLFVCAVSVSAAVLLIMEMSTPFVGVMKVSSAPLRDALANLGR